MTVQEQLLQTYGPPDTAHIQQWCVVWNVQSEFPWFPVHSFLVNKDFRIKLRKAFTALEEKGLHKEIHSFDGCYNDRNVRGSSSTSLHAWAAACDLNAKQNPMTYDTDPVKRHGSWSPEFVATMKSSGIFWGGDWVHRSDPMHFCLLNG
jgi:hypothetical protein